MAAVPRRACAPSLPAGCGQRAAGPDPQTSEAAASEGSLMAPVKISHVVSFSSQDPRHPAENLLRDDGLRPWLSCPRDRSGQLKVELQLERASAIGYVDVGNCGCAFLQVDVGRSSWPLERPYATLLPSVALMTPADAKLGRNRCRVRMFKEADFLAPATGQKWDRVRLLCSQPFGKHGQFGLSFLRVRTPPDADRCRTPPPPRREPEDPEPAASPWHSNPAFCRTFFPEPPVSTREEEQLKSRLQQLESQAWSPARLSRPARMLLSAARSRALKPGAGAGSLGSDQEQPAEDPGGPAASGSAQDAPAAPKRARRTAGERQRARSPAGRSLPALSRPSRSGGRAGARDRGGKLAGIRESRGESSRGELGTCPICSEPCSDHGALPCEARQLGKPALPPLPAGRFRVDLLPAHASSCGEEDFTLEAAWSSSPGADLPPDAWVPCPICELPFRAAEVERHASACGELGTSSAPFWAE
ncbi:protein XNDC1N [Apteryx mantelli]|uniref:Protein XNDC1N n=1 Tax=Apteryx mantelli TaxID=2696672 RepID=A0ABM4DYR7_9AVES